ncbi:MAG TPA: NADH-quinone oxidoreductase subunit C [Geobacteraceae bacterium]|nr:NADH-quinone oxidoreductase subunit C [Geobacteraceae bacterium]
MSEPQEIIPIAKHDLVGIVAELFAEGYRLVQIGCSTLTDAYELNYSFDREYRFRNLRVTVAPGEEIPSISVIYPGAFLYENEIHDLFGVAIRNIAVDYRGTLYRTAIRTPFSIDNVKLPEPLKQKVETSSDSPAIATVPADMPAQQKV